MEDFSALKIDGRKGPKKLDIRTTLFGRVVIGIHLATELFWTEDTGEGPDDLPVRHYYLLHLGPVVVGNGDYGAFEIVLPFILIAIGWLRPAKRVRKAS